MCTRLVYCWYRSFLFINLFLFLRNRMIIVFSFLHLAWFILLIVTVLWVTFSFINFQVSCKTFGSNKKCIVNEITEKVLEELGKKKRSSEKGKRKRNKLIKTFEHTFYIFKQNKHHTKMLAMKKDPNIVPHQLLL